MMKMKMQIMNMVYNQLLQMQVTNTDQSASATAAYFCPTNEAGF
jgi:hypothetical protein